MPTQSFGSVSFALDQPLEFFLTFGNMFFGVFASNSVTEPENNPDLGFATISSVGVWNPGSWAVENFGVTEPHEAELRISFTQTPAHTGAISASGTFAVAIPEPSSIVMSLTGLAAGVLIYRLRRRRRDLAMPELE